jgi:hypothetical protein
MPDLMVNHRVLGMVPSQIARLDSTVNEYDEKLHLGRHRESGGWAVYIDVERPQPPYPLFLVPDPLPTPRDLIERLQKADSHKRNILAEMTRANEAHMAEIDRKTRHEVGAAAEMVHEIAKAQGMASDNQSRRKIVKS